MRTLDRKKFEAGLSEALGVWGLRRIPVSQLVFLVHPEAMPMIEVCGYLQYDDHKVPRVKGMQVAIMENATDKDPSWMILRADILKK